MSSELKDKANCFIGESGNVLIYCEGDYLPFENLEEALLGIEKRFVGLLERVVLFLKNTPLPEKVALKTASKFDRVVYQFNNRETFAFTVQKNKDELFEALKGIELVKMNCSNLSLREEIITTRDQLISSFIQADKLIMMRETNEDVLKNISDLLRSCENYLLSFIPEGKKIDPYSINKVMEKLIFCSYEVSRAYHVSPYNDKLKKIEELLLEDVEAMIAEYSCKDIYNKVKKARRLIEKRSV